MRFTEITEGLRDPKDNPCWKGYYPVGTKQKGGRTVPNCVPKNESVAEDNDQYYAIVSKVNNKVLSTHQDLESAKDEWRGLDSGQRALFRVVTTKKAPQDWKLNEDDMPDLEAVGEPVKSTMDAERRMAAGDRIFVAHEMDEEPFEIFNVDDLKGYTYDQMLAVPADMSESSDSKDLNTRYFLGKLQARHPQARDIESAMAMDYMVSQRQDRRDITRLDRENDQEQAEIDDLQRSLDKLKSRGI